MVVKFFKSFELRNEDKKYVSNTSCDTSAKI